METFEDQDSGASSRPLEPARSVELVSKEALIQVLLHKGVCTADELLEAEHRMRETAAAPSDGEYVRITDPPAPDQSSDWNRPQHPMRRYFAKYRWSRRVGTLLFGWKWKKVKKRERKLEVEKVH